MTEIQRKVVKQGKWNVVSWFILAKGDKDKIAAWKQDLVRFLHVFNVCSLGSVGHLRAQQPSFHTELAIDTNITVTNTHVAVASTHVVVNDTHAVVSAGCPHDDRGYL